MRVRFLNLSFDPALFRPHNQQNRKFRPFKRTIPNLLSSLRTTEFFRHRQSQLEIVDCVLAVAKMGIWQSKLTRALRAIRERVNPDAVAQTYVEKYVGKDVAGIVGGYLRPDKLPYLDELKHATENIVTTDNLIDHCQSYFVCKRMRIVRMVHPGCGKYGNPCQHWIVCCDCMEDILRTAQHLSDAACASNQRKIVMT